MAVEEFDFVGITEEYNRSLELFRRLFYPEGSLDVTAHHQNPNRKSKFYDIYPDLRKKILELNEQDAYTYLTGVRRFRYLFDRVGALIQARALGQTQDHEINPGVQGELFDVS